MKHLALTEVFLTLVHEMAHDSDTSNTDLHSPEFYEKFYDLVQQKASALDKFVR